ncbi:actin depolymerizing protein [Amylostereum chailletii]|nr:actin depolymerizing protein [Amylostereum chailletii]
MSSLSGIGLSEELSSKFSDAVASRDVRFLKISIRNESLVPDTTFPPRGSLEEDLEDLRGLLEDDVPAYVLVHLDTANWLVVDYVPDSAKVRDKMLYASTRNSLTQGLGSSNFVDTLFATSKDDLTPAAYAAHKRHLAAPQPMTAREKEIEDVKAAERQAGGSASRNQNSPFSAAIGYKWTPEVESAIAGLADKSEDSVVVLAIDTTSETLVLVDESTASVDELASKIPASDPSYALFLWTQSPSKRQIVFLYTCPTSSPVKNRMIYSSGSGPFYQSLKDVLPDGILATRKLQTSDPKDLNDAYFQAEFGDSVESSRPGVPASSGEQKSFTRPRPVKKQR